MHVGIVAQRSNDRAVSLASQIGQALDVTVTFDSRTADALGVSGRTPDSMDECDLVVSIGGDGTFLYTARSVGEAPLMGVNLGEVGFLNATPPEEAVEAVIKAADAIRDGEAEYQKMSQVQATGDGVDLPPALNEVAVMGAQRGHGRGLDIDIEVDGELYSAATADGVIVATPTGSSAYNLSEGGPLIHPDTDALVVTEMCADGAMPPLVIDDSKRVSVQATGPEHICVVADGRTTQRIAAPASLELRRADTPVRVAGPELDFFAALGKLD